MQAAAAAPDHGRLRPTRLIALRGEAKDRFGRVLEAAYLQRCSAEGTPPEPAVAEKERTKLGRAPLVLVVASVEPDPGHPKAAKIPALERRDSTSAAVQNLLLTATSLGYGSMWRTGEAVRDQQVSRALGLNDGDVVVGFVYLGTIPETMILGPNEPDTGGLYREWSGPVPPGAATG